MNWFEYVWVRITALTGGTSPKSTKPLKGRGGVLILVGIGVLLGPFYSIIHLTDYWSFSNPETWAGISTLLLLSIGLEFVILVGVFIVQLFLIVWFFKESSKFPTWFVGMMVFNLGFSILDQVMVSMLATQPVFNDPYYVLRMLLSFVLIGTVALYMFKSQRVKATFIN
jgi:hypothetical protein